MHLADRRRPTMSNNWGLGNELWGNEQYSGDTLTLTPTHVGWANELWGNEQYSGVPGYRLNFLRASAGGCYICILRLVFVDSHGIQFVTESVILRLLSFGVQCDWSSMMLTLTATVIILGFRHLRLMVIIIAREQSHKCRRNQSRYFS